MTPRLTWGFILNKIYIKKYPKPTTQKNNKEPPKSQELTVLAHVQWAFLFKELM